MHEPLSPISASYLETDALDVASRMGAPAPAAIDDEDMQTLVAVTASGADGETFPRLVIRGENPSESEITGEAELQHSSNPDGRLAFVDWLNFTFPYVISSVQGYFELDLAFRESFGFGITANRNQKHLNYEGSWMLGQNYGIFATGGASVGGTSMVSLSGMGCSAVADWNQVYRLLQDRRARITRVDLSHDDFAGEYDVQLASRWHDEGRFNPKHGRPAKGKFIDDKGSNDGKTFYLGQRKNGKVLRVYEKGKQLGKPDSQWVRWELELHDTRRVIPLETIIRPGEYLAGSYPCMVWIHEHQSRIQTTRKTLEIGLDVLIASCKESYGKLFHVMRGLDMSDTEIVEKLIREGFPKRLDMPFPSPEEA